MKNYYQILGIPENASQQEIKQAFRKLAFQYHPDTNPGNEKWAEDKFKEINEAYGVLGDKSKKQQYDFARKQPFAGAGIPGFGYSQQDIFQQAFSNRANTDEMRRMFEQLGLRFDEDFLNRTFFRGQGISFNFAGPSGYGRSYTGTGDAGNYRQNVSAYKPNWFERLLLKFVAKLGKLLLRFLFGIRYSPPSAGTLDHHMELKISAKEAEDGGEKPVTYKRDNETSKLPIKGIMKPVS